MMFFLNASISVIYSQSIALICIMAYLLLPSVSQAFSSTFVNVYVRHLWFMCTSVCDVDVREIHNLNKNATNCHGNISTLSFYEELDTLIFRDTVVSIW
jgi:hypothetical protein